MFLTRKNRDPAGESGDKSYQQHFDELYNKGYTFVPVAVHIQQKFNDIIASRDIDSEENKAFYREFSASVQGLVTSIFNSGVAREIGFTPTGNFSRDLRPSVGVGTFLHTDQCHTEVSAFYAAEGEGTGFVAHKYKKEFILSEKKSSNEVNWTQDLIDCQGKTYCPHILKARLNGDSPRQPVEDIDNQDLVKKYDTYGEVCPKGHIAIFTGGCHKPLEKYRSKYGAFPQDTLHYGPITGGSIPYQFQEKQFSSKRSVISNQFEAYPVEKKSERQGGAARR